MKDTHYDKFAKKLKFEKAQVRKKKVLSQMKSEIDVLGFGPFGILKLHQTTRDALSHLVTEKEVENLRLKKRIHDLEEALSPTPLSMKVEIIPRTPH